MHPDVLVEEVRAAPDEDPRQEEEAGSVQQVPPTLIGALGWEPASGEARPAKDQVCLRCRNDYRYPEGGPLTGSAIGAGATCPEAIEEADGVEGRRDSGEAKLLDRSSGTEWARSYRLDIGWGVSVAYDRDVRGWRTQDGRRT